MHGIMTDGDDVTVNDILRRDFLLLLDMATGQVFLSSMYMIRRVDKNSNPLACSASALLFSLCSHRASKPPLTNSIHQRPARRIEW
jgi:hypothetical protein